MSEESSENYTVDSTQDCLPDSTQEDAGPYGSLDNFRLLAEAMPQFVWVSDAEGRVEYVNSRWTEYTGQTLEDTGQHNPRVIHPEDASVTWALWEKAKVTGEIFEAEFRCLRAADGMYRWFLARGIPLKNARGTVVRWIGTSTDIEAQKQAEAQILFLNSQLHRAVYEATHRAKNHFQVLAATVDLTLMEGRQQIPAEEVARLGTQIRLMSLLQDILTVELKADPTGSAVTVSSKVMLERVLDILRQATQNDRLVFEVEEAPLPIKTATSLALLLNEAVTNAYKHGGGGVWVLFRCAGTVGQLEVRDDGAGFPDGFDPQTAANTGMELMTALTTYDLNGTVEYGKSAEGGAKVTLSFPLQETGSKAEPDRIYDSEPADE